MKSTQFTDIDGTEISVSMSSLATREAYRIFIEGKGIVKDIDSASGNEIPFCLHLSRKQAEILINALQDLFEDSQ